MGGLSRSADPCDRRHCIDSRVEVLVAEMRRRVPESPCAPGQSVTVTNWRRCGEREEVDDRRRRSRRAPAGNPPYSIPPYSSCERLSSSMSSWTLQYRRGPQPRPHVAPLRHALLLDVATEQAVVLSVWRALQTTGAGNSRLNLALLIPVHS